MIFALIHLISVTLSHGSMPQDTVTESAFSLRDIALEEPVLLHVNGLDEFGDRKASACLTATWFYRESAFDPTVVGDKGTSFGIPQMKAEHAVLTGIDLILIKTNRKESIRAGYRLLRHEIKRCKNVSDGLGAYATGFCGGAQEKVKHRLNIAKGCWSM